jgi:hypothetical protein
MYWAMREFANEICHTIQHGQICHTTNDNHHHLIPVNYEYVWVSPDGQLPKELNGKYYVQYVKDMK